MAPIVFFNGVFRPEADAHVGVDDGGWLHGAGLFETMRAESGRVFRLDAHINRLMKSAETILRPIERSSLPSESVFRELLKHNHLGSARVRMTVSAGSVRGGASDESWPMNVCLSAVPISDDPLRSYERGVHAVVCDYRVSPSDPVAGHKTTSYLPRLIGMRRARLAGAAEAIWFTTQNFLAEGCISNVFLVTKGALRTPPLDTPVLPGITRSIILELAGANHVSVREEPLNVNDLLDADEVLLTNSIMRVMPVIRVERRDIGGGQVGPVAKKLLGLYQELVRRECGA